MNNTICDSINSNVILDKICDISRIIDPLQKKIIDTKNNTAVITQTHCFDFWGKNKVCDNCISVRAYNDNSTYVKIEYKKDKAFLITAVPYELSDRRVIVEILKDVTSTMVFDTADLSVSGQNVIHALIENMNNMSYHDSLTGIYNRRYIMEKFPVDLLNFALLSEEISIIMVDLDYFKNINDSYGHIVGDFALKNIASILSGCIQRTGDWIARYGGEEFFICLPGANIEFAIKTAEYMRNLLEHSPFRYEDKEFKMTASFGIYNFIPDGKDSSEELFKRVDEKLYLAKRNGRNRIEY